MVILHKGIASRIFELPWGFAPVKVSQELLFVSISDNVVVPHTGMGAISCFAK
jgi:hypothetical protein